MTGMKLQTRTRRLRAAYASRRTHTMLRMAKTARRVRAGSRAAAINTRLGHSLNGVATMFRCHARRDVHFARTREKVREENIKEKCGRDVNR